MYQLMNPNFLNPNQVRIGRLTTLATIKQSNIPLEYLPLVEKIVSVMWTKAMDTIILLRVLILHSIHSRILGYKIPRMESWSSSLEDSQDGIRKC
jgi:hypothetical protein